MYASDRSYGLDWIWVSIYVIIVDWIGVGYRFDGLDWIVFRKLDPSPTLRNPQMQQMDITAIAFTGLFNSVA